MERRNGYGKNNLKEMEQNVEQYDAIVIGSGQGGNPLADKLATNGERVALIERRQLGGTCVNTGCTPTKIFVASAQVAHYARESKRWGVNAGPVTMDMPAVLKRKNDYVGKSRSGWEKAFEKNKNVTLLRGSARFVAPLTIEVNGSRLAGKHVFINTGTSTATPQITGLGDGPYLTNESLLELDEVPSHLVVLGAGYIGLEFGAIFRRFGSEVTVIGNSGQILVNEDQDVADALQKALEAEGVRFRLNAKATAVTYAGQSVTVTTATGEKVSGSHLLLAAGRTPNTPDLDLEKAGVKVDSKGYVQVNDQLETSAEKVWALGDVKGGPAFTHISYNDYQIVYGNLYEEKSWRVSERIVPYAVFTDPQLGRVGMTEKQARAAGKKIKLGSVAMSRVARANERAETAGLMKIVVDAENDQVLGASILSVEGGETVQILGTLMLARQPYTLLKGAIYIHPTLAEGFFALMDSVK